MTDARPFELTFVPPARMLRDRTALLVIDMQYHDASADHGAGVALERLDPGCMAYFNERTEDHVIPTIQALLAYFRHRGLKVIYMTLGSQFRDLRDMPPGVVHQVRRMEAEGGISDLLWAQDPGFRIRTEIEPLDTETVINKTTWGAFNSTNLESVLRHMGVETVVLTGVSTSVCVETTARDAADRGFSTVVVDEGTADYDETAHREALRALHLYFCRVAKSADDVIAVLEAEAEL